MPRLALAAALAVALLAVAGCAARPEVRSDSELPTIGLVAIVNASTTPDRVYEGQFCGGVAVGSTMVATAAHCVANRSVETLAVASGGTDVCEPVWKIVSVTEVTIDRSVAMVHLEEAVDGRPAPVAALDTNAGLTARGWGRDSASGTYPCAAKTIPLAFRRLEHCISAEERQLTGVFCAVPAHRDNTCSGDSGGPVYQTQNGLDVVVGLVEGGVGCGPHDDGLYSLLALKSDLWDFGESPSAASPSGFRVAGSGPVPPVSSLHLGGCRDNMLPANRHDSRA